MEILKSAAAGTLESSDCMVTVEPGEGITLDLSSSVMNQYGRQIKAAVLETLERLGVHEHHGSAQAESFGLGSSDHLTAPPQGMLALDASELLNTAHSTRAFRVHSRAPLSTTVTLAF